MIIICIFSLMFMQGIKGYLGKFDQSSDMESATFVGLRRYYGSLEKTVMTLLAAISGGYDWIDVAEPIIETGTVYMYFFLFYVLFVTVGLLNIITGIFVHVALESSIMNRELVMDEAITNREMIVKQVIELFVEADMDGSGQLSWLEFQEFIQDEKIKAFLMSLELDISSCSRIFSLLDASGDGSLDPHEFVEGCIELRGNAKKVDVTLLQRENQAILEKLDALANANTEIADDIQNVVRSTAGFVQQHADAGEVLPHSLPRHGFNPKVSHSKHNKPAKNCMRDLERPRACVQRLDINTGGHPPF
jgi:Ca2+-binding EF-hand superfamily protein